MESVAAAKRRCPSRRSLTRGFNGRPAISFSRELSRDAMVARFPSHNFEGQDTRVAQRVTNRSSSISSRTTTVVKLLTVKLFSYSRGKNCFVFTNYLGLLSIYDSGLPRYASFTGRAFCRRVRRTRSRGPAVRGNEFSLSLSIPRTHTGERHPSSSICHRACESSSPNLRAIDAPAADVTWESNYCPT